MATQLSFPLMLHGQPPGAEPKSLLASLYLSHRIKPYMICQPNGSACRLSRDGVWDRGDMPAMSYFPCHFVTTSSFYLMHSRTEKPLHITERFDPPSNHLIVNR